MSLASEGAELAGNRASSVDQGPSLASVGDYVTLMKPRVMSLVVFTALVSVMIAPGHVHPVIGFTALLCIAVGAGAAGALNMWYDADIDAVMRRTSNRPIPRGRIAPGEALAFGIVLAAFASLSIRYGSSDRRRRTSLSAAPRAPFLPSSAGWRRPAASRSSRVSSSSSSSSGRRHTSGRCRSFA